MNRSFLPVAALSVLLLSLIPSATAPAKTGDTTRVRMYDYYLWTYYGSQRRAAVFPDTSKHFEKVLMHLRLKCPTGGCGEWDYTMPVYYLRPTGRTDSTLVKAPNFTVDGAQKDSVKVRFDTTYKYSFNIIKRTTDSTPNTKMLLRFYRDPANPLRLTDSAYAWPAGTWRSKWDTSGKKIDSVYIAPDSVYFLKLTDVYTKFQVKERFELGRFITPYGKWFAKDREFDWVYDVTDYQYMLHDSVEIETTYEGYSQGSLYTLDFELIEGRPVRDVFRVQNIYQGYFYYGNPADPIENHLTPQTITVDPRATMTLFRTTISGHGGGGTDNAAEFSHKIHAINVNNGAKKFTQDVWRYDCGLNPVFPQAGTWYFQRGGWCPGSQVYPYTYDLTPYAVPGGPLTVDYEMQDYTNADPSAHPAGYGIQAQILFATGPNFTNNVELTAIKKPNNAFDYRRMNPVCSRSQPVIVIRNNGKAPLRTLAISYGVQNGVQGQYNWTGNLAMGDTAQVLLPRIQLGDTTGQFTVQLSQPNGVPDEYDRDNAMTVPFSIPKRFSNVIYLALLTDKFSTYTFNTNGISYEVRDADGAQLYYKTGFDDVKLYYDTFRLADGCYQFTIYDDTTSGVGDGLLPIQGTAGYYTLRDNKGVTIMNAKSISPDYLSSFGNMAVTTFRVSAQSGVDDTTIAQESGGFTVYPNPTSGALTLNLAAMKAHADLTLDVFDAVGAQVASQVVPKNRRQVRVDLSGHNPGVYTVRLMDGHTVWSQKVVLNR